METQMEPTMLTHDSRWKGCCFTGQWQPATRTTAVVDKATGDVMSQIGVATVDDLAAAARAASAAQPAWAGMPPDERAAIFRRAAQLVDNHRDELAGWIMRESGGVRTKADSELNSTLGILHGAAAMMGEPQGVVLPSRADQMS